MDSSQRWIDPLTDAIDELTILKTAVRELVEALEIMMRCIGPPPRSKWSYDSSREDAWDKAQKALPAVKELIQ